MKNLIITFLFVIVGANAQVEKTSALYKTILKLDDEFFEYYNTCDKNLDKHAEFYTENVEFYHDNGGLSTSKDEIIASTKKNICNKVKRILVADSVEVHKIPNYGAIQIGYHKFHNLMENSVSKPLKFIVFWKKINTDYKIAKVVSLH